MANADDQRGEHLNDHLDARATGDTSSPRDLDPAMTEAVRRFFARDDAPGPSRDLTTRMWEDLMNQVARAGGIPLRPAGGGQPDLNGRTQPRPWKHGGRSEMASQRGWGWALSRFATAALLVAVLGLAYIVLGPPRADPDRPRSIPAVVVPTEALSDVPMFRGNPARTGEQPGPGPDPDRPVVERWAFTTSGVVYGSPAVVDGVVYVGGGLESGGNLYALDAASGEQRWSFATDGGAGVASSPAVVDGVVYVGSKDGNVYALDAASGQPRWAFATGGEVWSSPAVLDGVVYVGSNDGNLYAVDAATGEQRWAFATGGEVESSPAVVDGVVYVAGFDGNVYAVDAASGQQRWAFATESTRMVSSPAVVDGVVYVGSADHNVYAIDAVSGAQRWAFDAGDVVLSSPAVVDGVVYVGSGRVVGGGASNVYAIDAASGQQRWAFPTGSTVYGSPVVVDGVVYVGSWDQNLYALDAASGAQRWSFATDGPVDNVVVVDGIVYVGNEAAKVYALESAPAGTPAAATPTP